MENCLGLLEALLALSGATDYTYRRIGGPFCRQERLTKTEAAGRARASTKEGDMEKKGKFA